MEHNFFKITDILMIVFPTILLAIYLINRALADLFKHHYCSACAKELIKHSKHKKSPSHIKKDQILKRATK